MFLIIVAMCKSLGAVRLRRWAGLADDDVIKKNRMHISCEKENV